uniref:Transposase MuDR plant domain-containing protein n=1 Tax=Setaria italica TaxID=4555 RepID=K4AJ02_SETIT
GNEEKDLRIRGRFDAGDKRSHYVLMPVACDDDWLFYKELVKDSQVACAELVVDEDVLPANEVDEEEDDEEGGDDDCSHGSDDSGDEGDFDTCRVNNNFDVANLEDNISVGSEEEQSDGEDDIGNGGKEQVSFVDEARPSVNEKVTEPTKSGGEDDIGNGGEEQVSFVDEARPSVNEKVTEPTPVVQSIPTPMMQPTPMVQSIPTPMTQPTPVLFIEKGMRFDSLEELKFFLRDYSVRHHRPYNVVHSSAKMRYTVCCQHGCEWKVWARPLPDDRQKWRITRHSQCMACYIARRIAALLHAGPDISIAVVIETIKGFTNYVVKYGKTRKAKQHVIAMLWGDWKDTYGRVPRILEAIAHYNPGTKWCTHTIVQMVGATTNKSTSNDGRTKAGGCMPACYEPPIMPLWGSKQVATS